MSAHFPVILASGLGPLAPVIFFAIIAIINKIVSSATQAKPPPPVQRPQSGGGSGRSGNDEDEQVRKFMEALGLPPNTPQQKSEAVRRTQPQQPPTPPARTQATSASRKQQQQQGKGYRLSPPPVPSAAKKTPPRPAPQISIESIENPHVAELKTPEVPEFHTTSSTVTAIPMETGTVPTAAARASATPATLSVREMVRTPESLRAAFLLKEILGPPRGLQSSNIAPSFASP